MEPDKEQQIQVFLLLLLLKIILSVLLCAQKERAQEKVKQTRSIFFFLPGPVLFSTEIDNLLAFVFFSALSHYPCHSKSKLTILFDSASGAAFWGQGSA